MCVCGCIGVRASVCVCDVCVYVFVCGCMAHCDIIDIHKYTSVYILK